MLTPVVSQMNQTNAPNARRFPIIPMSTGFVLGIGVTAALFLVFSFLLERDSSEPLTSESKAPVVDTEQAETGESEPSESSSVPTQELSIAAPASVSLNELDQLARIDNDFERTRALYSLLEHATEEQLYALLEDSPRVDFLFRAAVQRALIHKLTTIDLRSALKQIDSLEDSDSEELVKSVFGHWARVDLDEAIGQTKSLDQMDRWAALRGIFSSRTDLSKDARMRLGEELGESQFVQVWNSLLQEEELTKNPEEAWYEIVEKAQNDNMQLSLLDSIAEAWFREDGLEVVDKIVDSISNQQTETNILLSVFLSAAETDPQGALNRALELESDPYSVIVSSVVNTWASSDPKSAVEALTALEPGSVRERLLNSVMQTWARNRDPFVMLEELGGMSEELQLLGNQAALFAIAFESPEKASELIGILPDSDGKNSVASAIARTWSQKNPIEALQWVLNSSDLETYRQDLLDTILRNLAAEDPELAMETALAQPTDSESIGLEATVVSSIAGTNVNKAIELLPQVRDGVSRVYAYGSVGMALIANGDANEALELAADIEESERDTYFRLLTLAWSGTNPEQLYETIDQFPSDKSKSNAAAILTLMHRMSPTLSDEQAEELKKYLSEEDKEEIEKGGMGLLNLGPYMDVLNF